MSMISAQDLQIINNNVARDQHNVTNVFVNEEKAVLALLKPVVRDGYHVPRCMDGTRESVFREIDHWLNGMSNYLIL
jgi:hypothetical protein